MLLTVRSALFFLFLSLSALADEPPAQWQYEDDQRIYAGEEIPLDSCVVVYLHSDQVREDTDAENWVGYGPPLTDQTIRWLDWYIRTGEIEVYYCNAQGA